MQTRREARARHSRARRCPEISGVQRTARPTKLISQRDFPTIFASLNRQISDARFEASQDL